MTTLNLNNDEATTATNMTRAHQTPDDEVPKMPMDEQQALPLIRSVIKYGIKYQRDVLKPSKVTLSMKSKHGEVIVNAKRSGTLIINGEDWSDKDTNSVTRSVSRCLGEQQLGKPWMDMDFDDFLKYRGQYPTGTIGQSFVASHTATKSSRP